MTWPVFFFLLALISFGLAAGNRVNLVALGLAFLTVAISFPLVGA